MLKIGIIRQASFLYVLLSETQMGSEKRSVVVKGSVGGGTGAGLGLHLTLTDVLFTYRIQRVPRVWLVFETLGTR